MGGLTLKQQDEIFTSCDEHLIQVREVDEFTLPLPTTGKGGQGKERHPCPAAAGSKGQEPGSSYWPEHAFSNASIPAAAYGTRPGKA